MNVYEYFQNIRRLDYKIKSANSEIERLTELITSASAVDYEVERVQNGKTEKEPAFVHTLDQIDEHRQKLSQMILQYEKYRNKAFERLDVLTPMQSRVLYLRYFKYLSLEDVANEINYSFFGCRYIYRAAIKKFKEVYGNEYGDEV